MLIKSLIHHRNDSGGSHLKDKALSYLCIKFKQLSLRNDREIGCYFWPIFTGMKKFLFEKKKKVFSFGLGLFKL